MVFEEADIVIRNCMILPMNNLKAVTKGLIAVKDGAISYMGETNDAPKIKAENILEGRGKLAMPGLINCHTHLAMTLFRGLAEDATLEKWLSESIWPLEAKLTSKDVYAGALLGCLEMVKNGVTCFADMYFFEHKVAEAVEKAGLRAVLSSGIIEANDRKRGEKLFREAVEFAEKYKGYADGRVTTFLGPHTAFTCSAELLARVREKASQMGLGVHIHVAESKEMAEKVMKKCGFSEVGFLEKLGFLDSDVLAAHCIHLTREDMAVLAKRDVKVAHNPVANMKLAQGVAKVRELVDAGVTVGLGTDGAASNNCLDMFESMKVAALLQKTNYGDTTVLPSKKVLEMATIRGAEALGLEKEIGSLEVGKRADVILVDLKKPNLTPLHDLCASLVYSAHGCDVDSVIVDGEVVMENREVKILDEEEVMEKAQDAAFSLLYR
ncbi:MAG: amidohydrolase [Candidatus Bathyarchaeota archaeon]|nr:amidohydrolase [Candidatus Bathyarchaeota archaeon]